MKDKALIEQATAWAQALLSNQKIEPNDDLFEMGATSLVLVQLTQKIEKETGVRVPVEVFMSSPTLDYIHNYVVEALESKNAISNKCIGDDSQLKNMPNYQAKNNDPLKNEFHKGSSVIDFFSDEGRKKLKAEHLNLRNVKGGEYFPLPAINNGLPDPNFRSTQRQFASGVISSEQFFSFLSLLRASPNEAGEMKYRYPSAGSSYSVQV